MIVEFRCKQDGEVVVQVIDRQENMCSDVLRVTQGLGKQTYHEVTGPECPAVETVTETTVSA